MTKCPRTGGKCPYPTWPCIKCLINLEAFRVATSPEAKKEAIR